LSTVSESRWSEGVSVCIQHSLGLFLGCSLERRKNSYVNHS
jgi:hypothetical protein